MDYKKLGNSRALIEGSKNAPQDITNWIRGEVLPFFQLCKAEFNATPVKSSEAIIRGLVKNSQGIQETVFLDKPEGEIVGVDAKVTLRYGKLYMDVIAQGRLKDGKVEKRYLVSPEPRKAFAAQRPLMPGTQEEILKHLGTYQSKLTP